MSYDSMSRCSCNIYYMTYARVMTILQSIIIRLNNTDQTKMIYYNHKFIMVLTSVLMAVHQCSLFSYIKLYDCIILILKRNISINNDC